MIAILMGVTGSGKTTVGHALAQATGWQFADADDFHSQANRAKMQAGIPLTDQDREPWLESLHAQIVTWTGENADAILACSALKESYRAKLIAGAPPNMVRFVYLTGPKEIIHARLEARQGHYMPSSLLPSQLETLQPPRDAIEIAITQSVAEIVRQIQQALGVAAHKAYAGESDTNLN